MLTLCLLNMLASQPTFLSNVFAFYKTALLVCRLSAEDSEAVTQYLLHISPQLHTSNSTSAAMVVLFCSSTSQANQRLQAAVALLQHLPLGFTPSHRHPHTHDHKPDATLTAAQVELVCTVLQLFTAAAFTELLAHKPRTKAAKAAQPVISDGAEQLAALTRFGADRPQDSLAAHVRQAAFQQLTAEVYACLPVQQQMKTFLVSHANLLQCDRLMLVHASLEHDDLVSAESLRKLPALHNICAANLQVVLMCMYKLEQC